MAKIKNVATLDSKGFNAGVTKMDKGVKTLGMSMKNTAAIGAAFVAGIASARRIASFSKGLMTLSSSLFHASKQAMISADSYQALKIIFEEAGSNASRLITVLSKIRTSQARALAGEKTQADAWERIGIEVKDLKGLKADELLSRIARAWVENGDSAEATRGVYEIFGSRSVPVLNEVFLELGKEGITKTIDKFKDLNQIIDEQTLGELAVLEDQVGRVERGFKIMALQGVLAVSDIAAAAGSASVIAKHEATLAGKSTASLLRTIEIMREKLKILKAEREKAIADAGKTPPGSEDDGVDTVAAARPSARVTSRRRMGGFGGGSETRVINLVGLAEKRNRTLEEIRDAVIDESRGLDTRDIDVGLIPE
jgi:hypothetical protein